MSERDFYPVQGERRFQNPSEIAASIYLRAYEVYSYVYGPQEAMVTDWCRGGFSPSEVIAFLYAYPFPKSEWSARASEAFRGMKP